MKNIQHLIAKGHAMPANRKIAITIGDASGIGPEIIIKALNSPKISVAPDKILLIGSKNLFCSTAARLNLDLPEKIEIYDIPLDGSRLIKASPSIESGKHSFLALNKACDLANRGLVKAIATAPASKEAMNQAGYNYTGQTEILEEFLSGKAQAEMIFVAGNLRIMLLTRHIQLGSVSSALTADGIIKSIFALNNSLIKDFNLMSPRIALCALNPHAGENGLLGSEENDFIKPAVNQLVNEYKIALEGPFPADTLWAKAAAAYLKGETLPYDAYVACYHDQGLIPVKMLAMNKAVNTTINLSVIRTSPSHGTAYDIAGQNKADCQSMIEAINVADILSAKYN